MFKKFLRNSETGQIIVIAGMTNEEAQRLLDGDELIEMYDEDNKFKVIIYTAETDDGLHEQFIEMLGKIETKEKAH